MFIILKLWLFKMFLMFVERNIFLNKIINYCIRCLENWKINWICIFVYIFICVRNGWIFKLWKERNNCYICLKVRSVVVRCLLMYIDFYICVWWISIKKIFFCVNVFSIKSRFFFCYRRCFWSGKVYMIIFNL